MKNWYKVNIIPHKNATSSAEIHIFDEIGYYGVDAMSFKNDFDKIKDLKDIRLFINSPGGSVFDGITIYNMLSTVRDKLTVEIDGLAASIASVIALAGGKRVMREGTFMMIHNPWTMMVGDATDLRKEAETLDKIKDQLVNIYESNSNLGAADIEAMMEDETWMTATEAKAMGFIDEKLDAPRIAASYNKELKDYGFMHTPSSQIENKETSFTIKGEDLALTLKNTSQTRVDEIKEVSVSASDIEADKEALQKRILQFKINTKLKQK